MRYQYRILQTGSLPLRPDGQQDRVEHRCTSTLIWPAEQAPSSTNAVLTDPCFTVAGYSEARRVLAQLEFDLAEIRHVFITHGHGDHLLNVPPGVERPRVEWFRNVADDLPGFKVVACPGHSEDSCSLLFNDADGRSVWVVGDAVLDREWLLAWGYYWPNGYLREEILQTWHSLALILDADTIVPGHGTAIAVTPELCEALDRRFDLAEYAIECGAVREKIRARARRIA